MMTETKRGRPRKFDEDQTLDKIMQIFWEHGYSATSLDQISAATGLNRPSLYGAFGSKKDMYLKIVGRFADLMQTHLRNAGSTVIGAKPKLKAIMNAAIDLYTGKTEMAGAPFGCLAISTLPAEAAQDSEFRAALEAVLARMDKGFCRLILAENENRITEIEAMETAQHLALLLHGLSIRARAGEPSKKLKQLATSAVDKIMN
ncbi:MAG: TetR/AcrR family transcriptional regulator [Roseibium sp.]